MNIELGNTSASIDPYLNPAYWNERFIGDGTAQPWPGDAETGIKDCMMGIVALDLFARQGASRLASLTLHSGDTFDANDYDPNTVLLTLAEKLSRAPKAEGVVPMTEFQDVPIPDRPTGIVDGAQKLEGHGYRYTARPLLNLVLGQNKRKVLVIPDAVVGDIPDFSDKKYRRAITNNMTRGFESFTVGEVHNFGNNDDPRDQTLARVTEAIVCMGGVHGRKLPSLKTLLAEKLGSSFSSATNPATS